MTLHLLERRTFSSHWLLAVLTFALVAPVQAERVILEDRLSYESWEAMQQTHWELLLTNKKSRPNFIALDSGKTFAMALLNRGVWRDFSVTDTLTRDFTLSIRMQMDHARRGQYVAITGQPNAQEIVSGYSIVWDSGSDGRGTFSINKFNLSEDGIGTLTSGDRLGKPVRSPVTHMMEAPACASDFALVMLTWSNSGQLTLSVNEQELLTVNDRSFATFSRVYLDGCETGYFVDLKLVTRSAAN